MSNRFLDRAVPGVQRLHPYIPGKPVSELEREYGVTNIIKLASNENPVGPGALARKAMQDALNEVEFYPDGGCFDLKTALAKRHAMDPDCITVGNGSNDVLVLLAEAFLTPDLEAIYSQYSFAVYALAVQAVGATARVTPANAPDHAMPLGHDLDAMAAQINTKTRLIFVANPNNPTGTVLGAGPLRSFIERVPETALVVIDEAYFEYVSCRDYPDTSRWLVDFPNLVVTRTFSKVFGLAGLRVGYSLSRPEIAEILNRVRQPFNVNSIAQVAAIAALDDSAHLEESISVNAQGLVELAAACDRLGLRYVPSVCNFLLVNMGRPAMPVYEELLRRSLIVRPVGNYGLPNHLRISIGLKDQNRRLIDALEEVLGHA